MPLFTFQAVPRGQNAFVARGGDNLVRLLGAAQPGILGIHSALCDLTVVDPHDARHRAIPSYFLEGCYLRLLSVREGAPAFDAPIAEKSLNCAAYDRIETALLAESFDFSHASLDEFARRCDNFVPGDPAPFVLTAADLFDLQQDDGAALALPSGVNDISFGLLANLQSFRLHVASDLIFMVAQRVRAVDRQDRTSRFRRVMSAVRVAADVSAAADELEAADSMAEWLQRSSLPLALAKIPTSSLEARHEVAHRKVFVAEGELAVARLRWPLLVSHLPALAAVLCGESDTAQIGAALNLALGFKLAAIDSVAGFFALEREAARLQYVLDINTDQGTVSMLPVHDRVVRLIEQHDVSARRVAAGSSSAVGSGGASSGSGSGPLRGTGTGAFLPAHARKLNSWLAVEKVRFMAHMATAYQSADNVRILRKAFEFQDRVILAFLIRNVRPPEDDLFLALHPWRVGLQQYLNFMVCVPKGTIARKRAAAQLSAANALVPTQDDSTATRALREQGRMPSAMLQNFRLDDAFVKEFLLGNWDLDWYSHGPYAIALQLASGMQCRLEPLSWPYGVFGGTNAVGNLLEVRAFGDELFGAIGYPKGSPTGFHGVIDEIIELIRTAPVGAHDPGLAYTAFQSAMKQASFHFCFALDLAADDSIITDDDDDGPLPKFPPFLKDTDTFFQDAGSGFASQEILAQLNARIARSNNISHQPGSPPPGTDGLGDADGDKRKKKKKPPGKKGDKDKDAAKPGADDATPNLDSAAVVSKHKVGAHADKVSISGTIATVEIQTASAQPVKVRYDLSKIVPAALAAGEDTNFCQICYCLHTPKRFMYCQHASDPNHATWDAPAHKFKLDTVQRRRKITDDGYVKSGT